MMPLVCRRVALSILGVAVFSCVLAQSAAASSVVVTPPNTTPCRVLPSYFTISAAVLSAPAGSTIYICPGTYTEQVVITKNLTLVGVGTNGSSGSNAVGANNPVITSPSVGVGTNAADTFTGNPIAAQVLVQTPSGSSPIKVTLEDLAIDGSNNMLSGCNAPNLVGIYYQNASGTINDVVTRYQEMDPSDFGCQLGDAIFIETGTGGSAAVTIANSSVHDYDKNGITVIGSDAVATIVGNYIVGIGATTLIAQNGIQISNGANGTVKNNVVTDDNYINPEGCSLCYGSSGILIWDTGATGQFPLTISGNMISNTQLAIVTYGDSNGTADWNTVTSNRIMSTEASGSYLDDGIDLCSNENTATSNTVYNSSASGVHIDSSCTESSGVSGKNTTVQSNTINEACAGVLLGNNNDNQVGGAGKLNTFYNVLETTYPGDACPAGAPLAYVVARAKTKHKPQPARP
jgi:hypothetical protein